MCISQFMPNASARCAVFKAPVIPPVHETSALKMSAAPDFI